MKKTSKSTRTSAPRFINDTQVLVTKEFAKNARIFGTPEYKLWKEIRNDVKDAEMVTKTIKKNPNKRVNTKNKTYENMALFIRQQDNAAVLMAKFQKQIALSKVQTNPYRCVLAWFITEFQGYDSYKSFFAEEAKKEEEQNNIFALVGSAPKVGTTSNVDADEEEEYEYDVASGM